MIRILVVDDQRVIRQGLRALLEPEPDFEVVGDADNGQVALAQVKALQPDVVLLDLLMPVMDGIAATRAIRQQFSTTKVLVLSASDTEDSLAQALQAGAMGYLLKDTPAEEIAQAIRSVHRGYAQMGPGLFEKLVSRVPLTPAPPSTTPTASDKSEPVLPELEVLRLLKSFDPLALEQAVQLAVAQQLVIPLFTQVCHYLERRPTNVAALYLAGALAHRHQPTTAMALDYLHLGLHEGIQQELPFQDLLLFYREGIQCNPDAVLAWMTPGTGLPLGEGAWLTLLRGAAQIVDPASSHYQTLVVLWQVHRTANLSEICCSLIPQLEGLQRGFKQLKGVLSV